MTITFMRSTKLLRRIDSIQELAPYAWWDASDTSTIVSSANAVSQWNDKSGNGLHLFQATASSKPTTGFVQNGLNTIQFASTTTDTPRYLQATNVNDWTVLHNGSDVLIGLATMAPASGRQQLSTQTSIVSVGFSGFVQGSSNSTLVRPGNMIYNNAGSFFADGTSPPLYTNPAYSNTGNASLNKWIAGCLLISFSEGVHRKVWTNPYNHPTTSITRPIIYNGANVPSTSPPLTPLKVGTGYSISTAIMHVGQIGEIVMITGSAATLGNAVALRRFLVAKWGTYYT